MIPLNMWQLLSASTAVKAIVGTSPVRVYDTAAPQDVQAPYIVWRMVTQVPQQVLDGLPPIDRSRISVYCWADTQAQCRALARAVRDVIQPHHCLLQSRVHPRDPDTQRFGISLDFDIWQRD